MIHYIKGSLVEKQQDFIILESQNIGYQIFMPESLITTLPETGSELKITTYQHIREDQNILFGFQTAEERHFFCQLISVSGVGPKLGLKLLSTITPLNVVNALLQNDIKTLTTAPGVGKKLAERLIIELKDKVSTLFPNTQTTQKVTQPTITVQIEEDLMLALKTLGYNQVEIKKALSKSHEQLNANTTLEEGVKVLLRCL